MRYKLLLRMDGHCYVEANSPEEAERMCPSIWGGDAVIFDHIEVEEVIALDDDTESPG